MRKNKIQPEVSAESTSAKVENNKIDAEAWVRSTFSNDVISGDEDSILMVPHMEAGSWVLILEYYTGVRHVNSSPEGTGNGQMVKISSFLKLFSDIIDENKSVEENLNNLFEYSEQKKLGYSWYFRLHLDRLQYENFVDIRECFAKLYAYYVMRDADGKPVSDYRKRLQDIMIANRKFKEFIQVERSNEGVKKFFSIKKLPIV